MDEQEQFNYDQYEEGYQYEEGIAEEEQSVPQFYGVRSVSNDQMEKENAQGYVLVPLTKMFMELDSMLDEVQGVIYLPKGWCLLMLREFKWDKDYLKEEYFNQMEVYQKKIGFSPKLGDPNNFKRGLYGCCQICCSEDIQLIFNICDHNFCKECWKGHLMENIGTGSPFMNCMGCSTPILMETVIGIFSIKELKIQDKLRRYEKKVLEEFITNNRNYQFCTGNDCGNCVKGNTMMLEVVKCICGKAFCFKCQSDDHYPCKCQEKQRWADQVMKEQADAKWISANAKICPWCKKAVERSTGCNYMACKCGKGFCYMCSKAWQPDHKDHFKCHIFKKKSDQQENRQKEVLEKMNHCTQRFLFNQAVANNYKSINIFSKREYIYNKLHIQLTDSEFMQAAYKFAIECCEKLKWIYAFTYFQQIKDKVAKERFDFALGEYERYKQNLLKMLAADFKVFIYKIEENDENGTLDNEKIKELVDRFRQLKKDIVNYYTSTKNYKQKFVEQLSTLTEELDKIKQKDQIQKYKENNKGNLINLSEKKSSEEKKGLLDYIGLGKGKKKKSS